MRDSAVLAIELELELQARFYEGAIGVVKMPLLASNVDEAPQALETLQERSKARLLGAKPKKIGW